MTTAIWQNKSLLKTNKTYTKPKYIHERPKGISDEEYKEMVRDFKYNKLMILDKLPKTKKSLPKKTESFE
jgi:hypothetical protein